MRDTKKRSRLRRTKALTFQCCKLVFRFKRANELLSPPFGRGIEGEGLTATEPSPLPSPRWEGTSQTNKAQLAQIVNCQSGQIQTRRLRTCGTGGIEETTTVSLLC